MKKIIVAALLALCAAAAFGQQAKLVVTPFENQGAKLDTVALNNLQDYLINAFINTGRFQVPDRNALTLLAQEQKFQLSDWADDAKSAQMGKVLNADYIVRVIAMHDGEYNLLTARLLDVNTANGLAAAEMEFLTQREARGKMEELVGRILMRINATGQSSLSSQCVVEYSAHASGLGWTGTVSDGEQAGTTGQSRQLEAIRVKVKANVSGGVRYTVHAASLGWLSWASDNSVAGTTGQKRRIEAVKVELTGELVKRYDIQYRVHQAGIGWLGWSKNGDVSGVTGQSRQIEAIQIKVTPK
jgi:TolB-like protein